MKKLIICALCAICGFTTANAQAKFGLVNTQEIIQAMPEFAAARADIPYLSTTISTDVTVQMKAKLGLKQTVFLIRTKKRDRHSLWMPVLFFTPCPFFLSHSLLGKCGRSLSRIA